MYSEPAAECVSMCCLVSDSCIKNAIDEVVIRGFNGALATELQRCVVATSSCMLQRKVALVGFEPTTSGS